MNAFDSKKFFFESNAFFQTLMLRRNKMKQWEQNETKGRKNQQQRITLR